MKKIIFSNSEKEKICELFENGTGLSKLANRFKCSGGPITKCLIEILGQKEYSKIVKEHLKSAKQFSKLEKLEKIEICKAFENGTSLTSISEIFKCPRSTLRLLLINFLGIEKYKKIANDHSKKNSQQNGQKVGQLPKNENQIEACRKNGRKTVKSLHEQNTKNHNWISRPEALFYLIILSKTFFLKDIVPQYYIKEIKHRADFAVPSQKLLFEVDGDRFHGHSGNPEMDAERIARDKEIDKWAKDNGWTIFRYNDKKMKELGIL